MSIQHTYYRPFNFSLIILLISSLMFTACGGGDTPPTTVVQPDGPTVKLTVSTVNVQEGKEASVQVDIQPYQVLDWTWEVSGSSGGSLNPNTGENVVYTAGKAGIDTVTSRATLADGTPLKQSVTINVEPAATEIPPATETPLPPKVTLNGFQAEQKVPCMNNASGTYPDGLEREIWPIVFVGGRYHPQDEGGKAAQKANGNWYQTVRFGDCVSKPDLNVGVRFQLIIVTANESANAAFEAYISNGQQTGQWSGMTELPSGAEEQVRVVVIRE